jgi:hypothetical protein
MVEPKPVLARSLIHKRGFTSPPDPVSPIISRAGLTCQSPRFLGE